MLKDKSPAPMNSRTKLRGLRGTSPHGAGIAPHRAPRVRFAASAVAVVLATALGCANTDDNQVTQPTVVGMSDKIGPMYSDGQTTIYQVNVPVKLPMRRPTPDEAKALGKADPYPHAPFLLSSDARIEVRFTLSNLDDKPHAVELLVDPWNEFVRYHPAIEIVSDEQTTPDFSGYDRFYLLPPKSRVEGTLTSDDMNELAVDLATVENLLLKNPAGANLNGMVNHVFNLQNRSTEPDPLIDPFIPKIIPGLVGFDLGLRSYEQGNVAVEIIIDVTDQNGDRVVPQGDATKIFGQPGTTIQPPPPATMN